MFVVKIKENDDFYFYSKLNNFTPHRNEAMKYTETQAIALKRALIRQGYDARTEMILFFGGENKCH